jgi:hypothetical protein
MRRSNGVKRTGQAVSETRESRNNTSRLAACAIREPPCRNVLPRTAKHPGLVKIEQPCSIMLCILSLILCPRSVAICIFLPSTNLHICTVTCAGISANFFSIQFYAHSQYLWRHNKETERKHRSQMKKIVQFRKNEP